MSLSNSPQALIFAGGWDGHKPEIVASILSRELLSHGFGVRVETSLEVLADREALSKLNLIVPCWTMGTLSKEQTAGLLGAVHEEGVGFAGVHGGMGDAFRGNTNYEWAVGGHFLGHPHVGDYTVRRTKIEDPITADLPESFPYNSEQYYMMVDPAIRVLAETDYVHEGQTTVMPVVWTKSWGKGRVFYSSLGHDPDEFTTHPQVLQMTIKGLLWATK